MRISLIRDACITAFVAIALIGSAEAQQQATSRNAYKARRAPDGHADISGIWEALGTANMDLEDHPSYGGPYFQPRRGNLWVTASVSEPSR
jgi:hypothetical protein